MRIKKYFTYAVNKEIHSKSKIFTSVEDCERHIEAIKEASSNMFHKRVGDIIKHISADNSHFKHHSDAYLWHYEEDYDENYHGYSDHYDEDDRRYEYPDGTSFYYDLVIYRLLRNSTLISYSLPNGYNTDIRGAVFHILENMKYKEPEISMLEMREYESDDGFLFYTEYDCKDYESTNDKTDHIWKIKSSSPVVNGESSVGSRLCNEDIIERVDILDRQKIKVVVCAASSNDPIREAIFADINDSIKSVIDRVGINDNEFDGFSIDGVCYAKDKLNDPIGNFDVIDDSRYNLCYVALMKKCGDLA